MIRAIVFDFGQTLVDSADGFRTAEKEMQRKACAALGPAAWEEFLTVYREIRSRFHARSDFSRKRILEAVFRHYGQEPDPALLERWETEYWERIKAMTRVFPEAEAVLTVLRDRYRLAPAPLPAADLAAGGDRGARHRPSEAPARRRTTDSGRGKMTAKAILCLDGCGPDSLAGSGPPNHGSVSYAAVREAPHGGPFRPEDQLLMVAAVGAA